ncbi:hypothetical protein U6G28_05720 [Actinomycetaceae bacterium MB13-C1-2]|nr:hypothetical protein U6G28_05720 [Actinomycetaceae bacterium MB13-C1-2]
MGKCSIVSVDKGQIFASCCIDPNVTGFAGAAVGVGGEQLYATVTGGEV